MMTAPSTRDLLKAFRDLDELQAELIHALCNARDNAEALRRLIEQCPATEAYMLSCYSSPCNSAWWRTRLVLHAVNSIVGTHGVEALGDPEEDDRAPPYQYLNAGDAYATTLIYSREEDSLFLGCWGDIASMIRYRFEDKTAGKVL